MNSNEELLKKLQATARFPELSTKTSAHPIESLPDIMDSISRAAFHRRIDAKRYWDTDSPKR